MLCSCYKLRGGSLRRVGRGCGIRSRRLLFRRSIWRGGSRRENMSYVPLLHLHYSAPTEMFDICRKSTGTTASRRSSNSSTNSPRSSSAPSNPPTPLSASSSSPPKSPTPAAPPSKSSRTNSTCKRSQCTKTLYQSHVLSYRRSR